MPRIEEVASSIATLPAVIYADLLPKTGSLNHNKPRKLPMPTITIDDLLYDLDALSDAAKGQLLSLQTVDRRIVALQEELAIHQTARNAYANALKALLPGEAQAATGAASSAGIQWPN